MTSLTGCAQYADRPADSSVAPNQWVPTIHPGGQPQAAPAAQPGAPAALASPSSVQERLEVLNELQKKGLVTPEEAKRKRQEILQSL